MSQIVNLSRQMPSPTNSSSPLPLSANQNDRTKSCTIQGLRLKLWKSRALLPDTTSAMYDMGGKYRRERIRSIHEVSIAQLAMLAKSQAISIDTRKMVEYILQLHEKVLLANQKDEHTFEPEMWINQSENKLEKQLKKESLADWEDMKERIKKTIQIRYADYFRQNVEALREAAMEDMYGDHKKAKRIIATENWKDISLAVKKEEDPRVDSKQFGKTLLKREVEGRRLEKKKVTRKHIRRLAVSKTNMNGDTALFNLHQYAAAADETEMIGSSIYAMGAKERWVQLAEQIVYDRKWLEANDLANEEDVCDKKQILKSILAFEKRFFVQIHFNTDEISREIRVQGYILTQKYQEIEDASSRAERMGKKRRFIRD